MVEKDKDLFLDMLENPNLTLEDMVSVGHSAESTRFLDKSIYENSQRVRNKFMDTEGNFKQDEFDRWYALAADSYRKITDKDTNLGLLNVTSFNESDITVSPEKRTLNTKPIVSFTPNPDRLSTSIYRVGKTSERERTQSELAQAEKVLLNPVEAAQDPSKARWGNSPNDSWWENFSDTQVLAQWDEDGEHIDPVTKQKVLHKKGELKLNENGTYYYEALDGRDIYGKQVLNKFNTITTDGSFWNQYDFFDSDDIKEKSFVGSVAKNLALVGSMFIPYVGWGIAGASIATQMIGLSGTLGKMLTGSDSPTFSAMEGWAQSFNRQGAKSEYAQQNMLCWENFINLIGDTTAQLREQRAIFKFAPALFGKGKYGIQSKHFESLSGKALKEKEMTALQQTAETNLNRMQLARAAAKGSGDIGTALARADAVKTNIISEIADKAVKDYFENYNKLGEQIARAYMVGITVGDTYGEAKEAGATDFEATMLTLGYAAAENKLLNSELGRWIFPELKTERATMTQIAKKVTQAPEALTAQSIESTLKSSGVAATRAELLGKRIAEMPQDVRKAGEVLGKLDKNSRLAWMKKWFNAGKEVFDTQKSVMKGTLGAAISNALAEGTEEVSEELLKDFSTSCFNIVKAAQGDQNTRMQGFLGEWDWNQALKRYGMSFFGGMIGGGINSAATDYTQFKDIANMTSEQAMKQLVWMERNNEMDKFWEVVSNQTLGDKYHSSQRNEDGSYKLGNENDNQDLEVKRALRKQIDMVHNILTANGASIDDEGLIGTIMNALPAAKNRDILGDFRANALATSVTAGRFLKEYNNLCKAIAIESINLNGLTKQTPDSGKPSDELQQKITESRAALTELLNIKNKLLQGERSAEFYRDALFETTYGVSEAFIAPTEVQFMEREKGKPYALISEEERKTLKAKYADWSKSERSEQIHQLADMFYGVAQKSSQGLQDSAVTYQQIKEGQLKNFQDVINISQGKLNQMMDILRFEPEDKLGKLQKVISSMSMDSLKDSAAPIKLEHSMTGDLTIVPDGTLSDMQAFLGNKNDVFINKVNEIGNDTSLTTEQQIPLMIEAFVENVHKELDKTAQEILKVGYVHPEVKRNLVPTLKQTSSYCQDLMDIFEMEAENYSDRGDQQNADKYMKVFETLQEIQQSLDDQVSKIEELRYTPIVDNLKSFAIGLGSDQNVLSLVEEAIDKEASYQEAIDNIILSEDAEKQFDEAEKILKLYRASIIAARNDNADVDHIFGYNKVLNELCKSTEGWIPLAEIDADTAQLALQDVNMAIERLNTIKGISNLNQGNKLNLQNYTAANKNFILYNKTQQLLTNLLNEDDDDAKAVKAKWNTNGALDDLNTVIQSMVAHRELTGRTATERTLSLNSKQREDIEKEQHKMDDALYEFFQKNKDKFEDNEQARKDLAQFIKATKLDFYDKNESLLTNESETIDDGSYLWLLASKAAMRSSDFYKEYRKIITDDIAPIPTQELGIQTAIAAIYNGDVFKAFGKAMKQSIYDDWKSKTPEDRTKFLETKGLQGYLPEKDQDLTEVLSSDLVPSFTNVLFIEGIPGSGKSTGVFKSIVKILNSLNPSIDDSTKLLDRPVIVAHSNKKNADDLASSLKFKDGTSVKSFGKEDLLKWMSSDYQNKENAAEGYYEYRLGKDVVRNSAGDIVSTWKVNKSLQKSEIPSVMFIDEWSRYTQPEVDLINRFASEYGIQVIAGGDMDQLSPLSYVLKPGETKVTKDTDNSENARNITPRVPKLGISMRTGNGQKSFNLNTLQNWQRHPSSDPVQLRYVETDKDIFGDKIYNANGVNGGELSDAQLQSIQKDIDKIIANLDTANGEKIGYIYHDKESKLYKLLQSSQYKDKIDAKSESAAQGLEARYYIVENNRSDKQTQSQYLKSLYTGVSRAEQAAIVIAPNNGVGKLKVKNPDKPDSKLIPDNFTTDGVARFAKARKALLDSIYGSNTSKSLDKIVPRTPESIDIKEDDSGTGINIQNVNNGGQTGTNNAQPVTNQQQLAPNAQQLPEPTFKVGDVLGNGTNFVKILQVLPVTDDDGNIVIGYKIDLDGNGLVEIISESKLLENSYQIFTPTQQQQPEEANPQQSSIQQPPEEPEAQQPIPTKWEVTQENTNKVIEGIINNALNYDSEKDFFGQVYVERYVQANPGDLDDIFTDLLNKDIIQPYEPGKYFITKATLNTLQGNPPTQNPEGSVEPPTPIYKVGDIFKYGVSKEVDYEVSEVTWDDVSQDFKYTLSKQGSTITRMQSFLQTLEAAGKYTPKEAFTATDGSYQQPELPVNVQGSLELRQAIEEDAQHEEEELEKKKKMPKEIAETSNNDIQYTIFGHTWNTNYLGVNFDEETGMPIMPQQGEPGSRRIDQANGLIKINPAKFSIGKSSQETCRKTIGTIRKSMMFDSNTDIIKTLQRELYGGEVKPLSITWNFISKSKVHNQGDGGRFFWDEQYRLDNMEDREHAEIPIKMLSMLVYDEFGNCILEMPIMTLGSPFTALYKLGQENPNNEIFKVFDSAIKAGKGFDVVMQEVCEAIDHNPSTKNAKGNISYGYKRLRDICQLWQFTNDGIMEIPNINKRDGGFNLHADLKNLGVHYVKDRITEETIKSGQGKFDYSMVWHELVSEASRADVNYSSVMIAKSAYDQNGTFIVPAGHTFVLRSDSDRYRTDKAMMDRYLYQQNNPDAEKIVKLELLSPPETSIKDFLMIERPKIENCHYGNDFSAYKILKAIRKHDQALFREIPHSLANTVNTIINTLEAIEDNLQPLKDEDHQQWMSRVYQEQKRILMENDGRKILSDALFHITNDYTGNDLNQTEPIEERCIKIDQYCRMEGITGELYRPKAIKDIQAISGFALLVQNESTTGVGKYKTPDGKSYRIYSKYDTPIFDISILAGCISNWANQAKTRKEGNATIWYFDSNLAKKFFYKYDAEGKTKKSEEKTENQKLKDKYSKLLEKLGLNDYDRLDGVSDQTKFLEIIRDKYCETPGNIATIVGEDLVYTNLSEQGVVSTDKFADANLDLSNATQVSFTSNNNNDNSYTLVVKNGDDTISINVEISTGTKEISFDLGKKTPGAPTVQPIETTYDFNPALTSLENTIKKLKKTSPGMAKEFIAVQQLITEGIGLKNTKAEIVAKILDKFPERTIKLFKKALGEEFFAKEEVLTQDSQEQQDNYEVCSIVVKKKL